MDQAFSLKNLKALLQEDRTKGGKLEEKYIPAAYDLRMKLYALKKRKSRSYFSMRKGKMTEVAYLRRVSRLDTALEQRKSQHENLIDVELSRISKTIAKADFRVSVKLLPSLVAGKQVYGIDSSLDQILAVRHVQRILKFTYDIKMPSRDLLIGQIKSLALDGVPKYIIRADVEQFYESVRHLDLLNSIHESPALSVVVKRILTRLIKDYVKTSGNEKGLPRGIGMSAYLAEIYLASIDDEIRNQEDLFYYARYVDDIVLMYAPKRRDSVSTYLSNVSEIINRKGLAFNSKTHVIDLLDNQNGKFEYLGYEFDASPSKWGVRLSQKKLQKYRSKIEKSFADYTKKHSFVAKKSAEELIIRSLYLTGNFRLFSRKSNAFIGIYFSNKFITDTSQLRGLDHFFKHKVSTLTDPSLKRKLAKLSFLSGFDNKTFRSFDPRQLSEISKGWNHG